MNQNSGRLHSKFSASGAERWFNCPGSVNLSEGVPDKESVWAKEGTHAHNILERLLLNAIKKDRIQCALLKNLMKHFPDAPASMVMHARNAANFILNLHHRTPSSEIMVETRIHLGFIDPEMFGTFDGAVIDHFDTLHVFDFKYGAGHAVSPNKNLQMIFYGLGLASLFHWNFNKVRLWIIQPRIRGFDGPTFWEISIKELMSYVKVFKGAVTQVKNAPDVFREGPWCHWCKAKNKCPLKQQNKTEKALTIFSSAPVINF